MLIFRHHPKEHLLTQARLTAFVLGGLAAALLLALAFRSPASAATELELDTYRADNSTAIASGPVLQSGQQYDVTIAGTYSVWPASKWQTYGTCAGTPENMPMFPSPATTNGPVHADAAWYFAFPGPSPCDDPHFAAIQVKISLDGGATFETQPPDNLGSGPNAGHSYHYVVTGEAKPIAFKLHDSQSNDNYGILKINVAPAGTPTATPFRQTEKWGDNNCDGSIATDDVTRALAALSVPASVVHLSDCPDMGQVVELITFTPVGEAVPQGAGALTWGAIDCTQTLQAIHALNVLRHIANLSVLHVQFCPDIGDHVTFQ